MQYLRILFLSFKRGGTYCVRKENFCGFGITVWKFKYEKLWVMIYLGWFAQHLFQTAYCVLSYIAEAKTLKQKNSFPDFLEVSRCDLTCWIIFTSQKHQLLQRKNGDSRLWIWPVLQELSDWAGASLIVAEAVAPTGAQMYVVGFGSHY